MPVTTVVIGEEVACFLVEMCAHLKDFEFLNVCDVSVRYWKEFDLVGIEYFCHAIDLSRTKP